jgi:hypothetical protein
MGPYSFIIILSLPLPLPLPLLFVLFRAFLCNPVLWAFRCDVTCRATWILGFVHSPVYRNTMIKPDVSEAGYQGMKQAISNGPNSVCASPTLT